MVTISQHSTIILSFVLNRKKNFNLSSEENVKDFKDSNLRYYYESNQYLQSIKILFKVI